MNIGYRVQDDPQGIMFAAATVLHELQGDEDSRRIYLIGIAQNLDAVESFDASLVERLKDIDALAVYLFRGNVDYHDFRDIDVMTKMFLLGVEDQLARKVVYLGGPGKLEDDIIWHEVPLKKEERFWQSEAERDAALAAPADITDEPAERNS